MLSLPNIIAVAELLLSSGKQIDIQQRPGLLGLWAQVSPEGWDPESQMGDVFMNWQE